jgi:hypothetical protein
VGDRVAVLELLLDLAVAPVGVRVVQRPVVGASADRRLRPRCPTGHLLAADAVQVQLAEEHQPSPEAPAEGGEHQQSDQKARHEHPSGAARSMGLIPAGCICITPANRPKVFTV